MMRRRRIAWIFATVSIIGLGVSGALAQDKPASAGSEAQTSSTDQGEIVVTAQKRSERLSDVPLSITAANANQLQSLGVTNAYQFGELVSGFHSRRAITVFLSILFVALDSSIRVWA